MGLIDREVITNLIHEVGAEVLIYLPDYTVDFKGDVENNYLGSGKREIALIRTREEMNLLNEQGLQYKEDAVGFFSQGSCIQSEAEVWVKQENEVVVYYVIRTNYSRFENETKFVRADLEKRRTEPLEAWNMPTTGDP